ncbi:MAG TPA: sugar phosphate isomerase/epimerase family protein [Acidobacteriota bacterium]|nr:sugar phosphate isomerase/epimerase family protein [Acidobacteriota bacterium]
MKRRDFILSAGQAVALAGLSHIGGASESKSEPLKVCVFSKHLQFLDWSGLAQTALEIGFDGIDLTVRDGGHVLPERVEQDLPRAAEIIRKAGLSLPMVTTGIVDADSPYAEAVVRTAGKLAIPRYRWGGFRYADSAPIPEQLVEMRKRAARLADLNRKYGVCAMYHTHSGPEVGAPIWDLWEILRDLDKEWLGVNYDIAHATIEGGLGAWVQNLRLITPWVKGIALKDFYWSRDAKGKWQVQWCPIGEGMVNFKVFFAMVRKAGFSGPVQMHFEYPLGGAEKGNRTTTMEKSRIIEAMRRDLVMVRGWLKN